MPDRDQGKVGESEGVARSPEDGPPDYEQKAMDRLKARIHSLATRGSLQTGHSIASPSDSRSRASPKSDAIAPDSKHRIRIAIDDLRSALTKLREPHEPKDFSTEHTSAENTPILNSSLSNSRRSTQRAASPCTSENTAFHGDDLESSGEFEPAGGELQTTMRAHQEFILSSKAGRSDVRAISVLDGVSIRGPRPKITRPIWLESTATDLGVDPHSPVHAKAADPAQQDAQVPPHANRPEDSVHLCRVWRSEAQRSAQLGEDLRQLVLERDQQIAEFEAELLLCRERDRERSEAMDTQEAESQALGREIAAWKEQSVLWSDASAQLQGVVLERDRQIDLQQSHIAELTARNAQLEAELSKMKAEGGEVLAMERAVEVAVETAELCSRELESNLKCMHEMKQQIACLQQQLAESEQGARLRGRAINAANGRTQSTSTEMPHSRVEIPHAPAAMGELCARAREMSLIGSWTGPLPSSSAHEVSNRGVEHVSGRGGEHRCQRKEGALAVDKREGMRWGSKTQGHGALGRMKQLEYSWGGEGGMGSRSSHRSVDSDCGGAGGAANPMGVGVGGGEGQEGSWQKREPLGVWDVQAVKGGMWPGVGSGLSSWILTGRGRVRLRGKRMLGARMRDKRALRKRPDTLHKSMCGDQMRMWRGLCAADVASAPDAVRDCSLGGLVYRPFDWPLTVLRRMKNWQRSECKEVFKVSRQLARIISAQINAKWDRQMARRGLSL